MRTVILLAVIAGSAASLAAQTAATTAATREASAVDQAIASLRERGQPATFADLHQSPLPNDKNGVTEIVAAGKLMVPESSGPRSSALEYSDQLPYPPEWHKLAAENVRVHAEVLSLLRKAREKGGIAWDDAPRAPFSEWMQKEGYAGGLGYLRNLANILADAALYAHFQGDDAEALARLQDLEFLGNAVAKRPFLVSKLVALGISGVQTISLQTLSTELMIEGSRIPKDDKARPARREAVKTNIAALLDDEPAKDLYRRALREERTILIEEVRGGAFAALPQASLVLRQSLQTYDAMIAAIDKPAWEQTQFKNTLMLQTLTSSVDRVRQSTWRIILLRRIAAVSLAAAMYRNDRGSSPATLNDLVPEYIPAIPADPYARDGAPLLYRLAEDGRRPLLGSVGPDGQEAADAALPPEVHYGWYSAGPGEPDDVWIDLAAWNPAAGQ